MEKCPENMSWVGSYCRKSLLSIYVTSLIVLSLTACDSERQVNSPEKSVNIYDVNANWNPSKQVLRIVGKADQGDQGVEIHDASDGKLLGTAYVLSDNTWSASVSTPVCKIRVSLPSGTVTRVVENAPEDCEKSSNIQNRSIGNLSDPNLVFPQALISTPEAVIANPVSNVTINPGDTVDFKGQAIGASAEGTIKYFWNMVGGALNSMAQNPGAIQFYTPGVYKISLSVTDATGAIDPTPPTRIITVRSPTSANEQLPSVGGLTSPDTDIKITPGQSVFFSTLPSEDPTHSYLWTFNGAAPPSNELSPGDIIFNSAGQYVVDFSVLDSQGVLVGEIISRIVTVIPSAELDPIISPIIISPGDNVPVNAGAKLMLMAALKRYPNGPPVPSLSFEWEITRASDNSQVYFSSSFGPLAYVFEPMERFYVTLRVYRNNDVGLPELVGATTHRVNTGQLVGPGDIPGPIIFPTEDITFVYQGDSISFQAASIPTATEVSYSWLFGGNAEPSTLQGPLAVKFDRLGTQTVELSIKGTDSSSLPFIWGRSMNVNVIAIDDTPPFTPVTPPPDMLLPSLPLPTIPGVTEPESYIASPAGDITIAAGQSVNFTGRGFDPLGGSSFQFEWRFDNVTPANTSQNPGSITFNQSGTFLVTLVVTNDNNVRDTTPAKIIVTVN